MTQQVANLQLVKQLILLKLQKNCGYDNCIEVENEKGIDSAIATWIDSPSLTFLYIRISPKVQRKNLGRPKVSPEQVAIRFKAFINKKMTKVAAILAAGLGSRIKEFSSRMPKGFIEINGISLIERSIKI